VMPYWIFVMFNISTCQIWRNWDAFFPSPTVPKWRCLVGCNLRCGRDVSEIRGGSWGMCCGSDSVEVLMELVREQISSHVARWRLVSDWQVHVSPSLSFTHSLSLPLSILLFILDENCASNWFKSIF